MTKQPKITSNKVIAEAELALEFIAGLIWRDKKMNACGLKAGTALDVHVIEKAIKSIRRYKRQKKSNA